MTTTTSNDDLFGLPDDRIPLFYAGVMCWPVRKADVLHPVLCTACNCTLDGSTPPDTPAESPYVKDGRAYHPPHATSNHEHVCFDCAKDKLFAMNILDQCVVCHRLHPAAFMRPGPNNRSPHCSPSCLKTTVDQFDAAGLNTYAGITPPEAGDILKAEIDAACERFETAVHDYRAHAEAEIKKAEAKPPVKKTQGG